VTPTGKILRHLHTPKGHFTLVACCDPPSSNPGSHAMTHAARQLAQAFGLSLRLYRDLAQSAMTLLPGRPAR
jgi:hypothetical protein